MATHFDTRCDDFIRQVFEVHRDTDIFSDEGRQGRTGLRTMQDNLVSDIHVEVCRLD